MKRNIILISLLCIFGMVTANDQNSIPLLSITGFNWTDEEANFIIDLNRKGHISIATKISSAVYMPEVDGSISGFHYNILNEFAELTDIKIDVQLVNWSDYFFKAGEDVERIKVDPDYSYVPKLIENVDLYIDGITVLPWREKMFDIIKYVPSRQMIVSRKEDPPKDLNDLNNKVCAMIKNTSMSENLASIERDNQLHFKYLYTENFDEMDKMVFEGDADFTVYDSDRAFSALYNYDNLTILWPISEPQVMGWAIHKDKKILRGILQKYLLYAQNEGILDKYWKISYGVSFHNYLKILKLEGPSH